MTRRTGFLIDDVWMSILGRICTFCNREATRTIDGHPMCKSCGTAWRSGFDYARLNENSRFSNIKYPPFDRYCSTDKNRTIMFPESENQIMELPNKTHRYIEIDGERCEVECCIDCPCYYGGEDGVGEMCNHPKGNGVPASDGGYDHERAPWVDPFGRQCPLRRMEESE